jgi:prepilin-type N-terminal cleavage/methylation domain-containing protein
MRSRLLSEQGFTLIETLLAATLGAMVLMGAYGLYRYVADTYRTSGYIMDLQRRAYDAMSNITRDLREAETVTVTDLDADGIDDRIDAILKTDSSDGVDNLVEADYWIQDVNGDGDMDLRRYMRWEDENGDGLPTPVTETLVDSTGMDRVYVDDLQFNFDGVNLVTVRLRMRLKMSGGNLPDEQRAILLQETNDCKGEDCIELYTHVYIRNVPS